MNILLGTFYTRYQSVMRSELDDLERDNRLAAIMTDMERTFKIPLLQDQGWESKNRPVISLYLIISESRKTLS